MKRNLLFLLPLLLWAASLRGVAQEAYPSAMPTMTVIAADGSEEETTAAYDVANLKQVTVADGKKANANAFCAQLDITEVKDSYTVTLRRAVSRVVLWEKNHIKPGASLKFSIRSMYMVPP